MLALIEIAEDMEGALEDIIAATGGRTICTDRDGIIVEPFDHDEVVRIIDGCIKQWKKSHLMERMERDPIVKKDFTDAVIRHFRETTYVGLDESDIENAAWEKFLQFSNIYSSLDRLIGEQERDIDDDRAMFSRMVKANDVMYRGIVNQAERQVSDVWRESRDTDNRLENIVSHCVSIAYEKMREDYIRNEQPDRSQSRKTADKKRGGR